MPPPLSHTSSSLRAIDVIQSVGVLPAVDIDRREDAVDVCKALQIGGVSCVEITLRTPAALAAIEVVRQKVPEVIVGAGTVRTCDQVDEALRSGAQFLVAPCLNPKVIAYAIERDVMFMPGVATPSEIETALGLDIDVLKFFPAEVSGGPAFLRAVYGPFRTARFVVSGGITARHIGSYLATPNVTACSGSWMTPSAALKARDYETVTTLAREAVTLVADARARTSK